MTTGVQHIPDSFNDLSETEKHELVVHILRHTADSELPRLSDDGLALNAEALFVDLDRFEAPTIPLQSAGTLPPDPPL